MNAFRANGLEISRSHPRVVGTIVTRACLEGFPATGRGTCEVAEVRLDQIGIFAGWIEACRRIEAAGTPVLLTLRAADEGGKCDLDPAGRLKVLQEGLSAVSMIDVELRSRLAEKFRPEIDRAGKALIVSYHDFSGTPSAAALEDIIAEAAPAASVVKVAAMVKTDDDLRTLETALARPRDSLLCLIGMGEKGRPTRTGFPRRGSCLTYGYLDSSAAPGQYSAAELVRLLRGAPLQAV